MRPKSLFFLIIIVLLALFFGMLLRNSFPDGVVSRDRNLILHIDETNLPEGMELKDLSIAKGSVEDLPFEFNEKGPAAIYYLEPAGVKFANPVDFTLEVDIPENTVPEVFHFSEDSFDYMQGLNIEIDGKKNVATIKGQIDHFSGFYVLADTIQYYIEYPHEVLIGNQFEVTSHISKVDYRLILSDSGDRSDFGKRVYNAWSAAAGYTAGGQVGRLEHEDPWTLQGTFINDSPKVVSPIKVFNRPAKKQFTVTESGQDFKAMFTCETAGRARFTHDVTIQRKSKMTWSVSPPSMIRFDFSDTGTNNVKINNPGRYTHCVKTISENDMLSDPDKDCTSCDLRQMGALIEEAEEDKKKAEEKKEKVEKEAEQAETEEDQKSKNKELEEVLEEIDKILERLEKIKEQQKKCCPPEEEEKEEEEKKE